MRLYTNEIVRIKGQKRGGINEFGRIQTIFRRNGKQVYWVVNGNMPFIGTISAFFSKEQLEKV